MHRAATAGEEEATAAPNWPLSGQRAMIEKVIKGHGKGVLAQLNGPLGETVQVDA
jgi:hypothetical protein